MSNLVRMKALRAFSTNAGGAIVVGDPDHPLEIGRYPEVKPGAVQQLVDAGDAEPYSLRDQARDEARAEAAAEERRDAMARRAAEGPSMDELIAENQRLKEQLADQSSDDGADDSSEEQETPAPAEEEKRQDANDVRDERTDTSAVAKAKGGRPRKTAAAPVGGNDTNATTNHPKTAANSAGGSDDTNAGASGTPDPDAAPR